MQFKDYYGTLGVDKSASQKEIKQAYRRLARKFHPDVNPGSKSAETSFKEVNEAYEVLGDPAKRRKYDELGANWQMYEQAERAAPGQAGGSPFGGGVWTVDFGDGSTGAQRMTDEQMRDLFGNEDPFSDFFRTFFGGPRERPGARAPRGRRGRDVEHEVELTLDEAFHGTTRRIRVTAGGRARSVNVRIPAGVHDGARVRAAGEGESGSGGQVAGDLFLRVRIRPHDGLERRGDDLHVKVQVPVTTAVLGGEAEVRTLSGPVRLRVPPMTQAGQVLRLKGHGMPIIGRGGERGDLYAIVSVQIPTHLTPDERAHYEALSALASAHEAQSRR